MKKRLFAIIISLLVLSLCGCAATPSPADDDKAVEDSRDSKDKPSGKKNKKGKKKDKSAEKESGDINYSYTNHPIEVRSVDDLLVEANYYTIELDEEVRDLYPDLFDNIDSLNEKYKDEMISYVKGCEDEVIEMKKEGMPTNYAENRYFTPVRSDDKVFSYVLETYSFLGGAHGVTNYITYNFDPENGKNISLNDVITEPDALPAVIVEDLLYQNEDLVEYFKQCPSDKENLLENIKKELQDNSEGFSWTLDYDGIIVYFEDYAMGSYAAGSRSVSVRASEHAEIFKDTYVVAKENIPDIRKIAKEADEAETEVFEAKSTSTDIPDDAEDTEQVELSNEQRKRLSIFLSNFAEQSIILYDEQDKDMSAVAEFAYQWSKINKPSNVEVSGMFYRIKVDTVISLAKKYYGLKVTPEDLYSYPWEDKPGDAHCDDGYYYVPAADGESYNELALVQSVEDAHDGTWRVYFLTYSLDLDAYEDNQGVIPNRYYALTTEVAADDTSLIAVCQGYAVVRLEGDSYTLKHFEQY